MVNTTKRHLTDLLDLASRRIDAAERSPGETALVAAAGGTVAVVAVVVLPPFVAGVVVGGAAVNAVWSMLRVTRESRLTLAIGRMVRLTAGQRLMRLLPSPATDGRVPAGQGRPGSGRTHIAVRPAA